MAMGISLRCRSLSQVKQVQAHLVTGGKLSSDTATATKLLELCAGQDISYAARLLLSIPLASTNHWNAIIRGLALSPRPSHAIPWFRLMLRNRRRLDALTCSFTLKACSRSLAPTEASQVHSFLTKSGFAADLLLMTTLLDVYSKVGDLPSAHKVFDEMPSRDAPSWNALIAGFAQGSLPRESLELFWRMRGEAGLRPDCVTVLAALSACSQLGAFTEGEEVHAFIVAERLDENVMVCNALIDMYAKCGFLEKAFAVFHGMRCEKCLVTWNTMIMASAMHGDARRALGLFEEMKGDGGMQPDEVSYLGALCACNHAGLVDEGVELFESMPGLGLVPGVKHYGSVVDLLGRAGRLREAHAMVISARVAPDIVLWQTLLGACKTYGNVEIAEVASEKLAEMGSFACGDFVLLSNIYAFHKRWDDVKRVRETMKRRDMKKIPGLSYTEVDGVVHEFVNGDRSHEKWREIYAKLDEINVRVQGRAY